MDDGVAIVKCEVSSGAANCLDFEVEPLHELVPVLNFKDELKEDSTGDVELSSIENELFDDDVVILEPESDVPHSSVDLDEDVIIEENSFDMVQSPDVVEICISDDEEEPMSTDLHQKESNTEVNSSVFPSHSSKSNQKKIPSRKHQCLICDKKFFRRGHLASHLLVHQGGIQPYICDSCGRRFKNEPCYIKHILLHSTLENYKCESCKNIYTELGHHLTAHVDLHSGNTHCKCIICEEDFTTRSELTTHMIRHSSFKPYHCDMCGLSYTYESCFTNHMKLLHSGIQNHKSDISDRNSTESGTSTTHMEVCSENNLYKCNICGKRFTLKDELNTHMTVHSRIKAHKCNVCGKGFSVIDSLTTHMLVHSGNDSNICNTCGMRFTLKANLTTHMKVHSIVKSHECNICGKVFSLIDSLTTHMLVHSKIDPYICNICGESFNLGTSLTNHMLTH